MWGPPNSAGALFLLALEVNFSLRQSYSELDSGLALMVKESCHLCSNACGICVVGNGEVPGGCNDQQLAVGRGET